MSRKSIYAIAVAVIALGALSSIAAGALFSAATMRVPRRLGPAPAKAVTVAISAPDGATLSAWWIRSPTVSARCVVVLHGIADSRVGSSGFAPMFLTEGYSVLLPDSRAHGASGGRFVTYGLLERYDAIAWTKWMRRAGCRRIFGLGESLGASILIEAVAIGPDFDAIVAECAFADLRDVAEYRMRKTAGPLTSWIITSGLLYAKWAEGLDLLSVSPLDAIAKASTPILLIHGLADTETPPINSMRLAKANPRAELWLVPNAVHVGAANAAPEEFRARILAWLSK